MSEPARNTDVASELIDAPDRIRVAQDSDGFWTCREARIGSQEYIRADLARVPITDAVAGWKLVPSTPTPEMVQAGVEGNPTMFSFDTDMGFPADVAHDVYYHMVKAAPAHPLPQGEAGPADSLVDAATALTHFAWSAVTADCDESREYLTSLLDNLRAALATHPIGEAGDTDDHARGCQGREYTCTCGYDDRRDALLTSLRAERDQTDTERANWKRWTAEAESSLAAEKQRREDAEHDATRLHSEKMDAIDARLVAEQRVVKLEADRARLISNPQAERYWEARWRDEVERVAALEGAGDTLLNRLDEYDPGDGARDFCGHVEPAIERFRAALRPAETGEN